MDGFRWDGFDRGSEGAQLGFIRCQACGQRWLLPKCRLRSPTPQTVKVLQLHQISCPARPDAEAGPSCN